MKIIREASSRYDFDFWSGAKDTVKYLTDEEVSTIFGLLEELCPEGMTETEVNDFFWFEDDTIAEWLGFDNFSEIIHERIDSPRVCLHLY